MILFSDNNRMYILVITATNSSEQNLIRTYQNYEILQSYKSYSFDWKVSLMDNMTQWTQYYNFRTYPVQMGNGFRSKWLLYFSTINLRRENYDLLWFVDSDMSLQNFDGHKFFDTFKSAWPLVAQPTIYPSTQDFWAFNHANVRQFFRQPLAKAYPIPFIEQQAPLFRASYFRWWSRTIAPSVLPLQERYETDWGIDKTWCPLSVLYTSHITPCILIPIPLEHTNARSITIKNNASFKSHGKLVKKMVDKIIYERFRIRLKDFKDMEPGTFDSNRSHERLQFMEKHAYR